MCKMKKWVDVGPSKLESRRPSVRTPKIISKLVCKGVGLILSVCVTLRRNSKVESFKRPSTRKGESSRRRLIQRSTVVPQQKQSVPAVELVYLVLYWPMLRQGSAAQSHKFRRPSSQLLMVR